MIKRIIVFFLVVCLFMSSSSTVYACDEEQSNYYVRQILFGNNAVSYESNVTVEKLLNALYICSEQSNREGQDKLTALKNAKVSGVPSLNKINIGGDDLFDCAHNSWEYVSKTTKKAQAARKNVLRKTVISVFDFGWFNERFNSTGGKIDSFSALLYYVHILADYLADDPVETSISAKGYDIVSYSGVEAIELYGNKPSFTFEQKSETQSYKEYSPQDAYGRCGSAITNIGPDTLENVEPRNANWISGVLPTGWNQKKYEGIMPAELFNRCHLIAHQLGGIDTKVNLVTGTRYLNEAMIKYEDEVADYIEKTENHVLYRATPVYVGDNLLASGIQLEAFSIEDSGKGICFNVYLYNVQPGVDINYANGNSTLADEIVGRYDILPFAIENVSDNNPDLMYEISNQLKILFEDQKNTNEYKSMINDLELIANEARNVGGEKSWEVYQALKKCQYEYVNKLKEYVPKLLKKEKFFNTVFK